MNKAWKKTRKVFWDQSRCSFHGLGSTALMEMLTVRTISSFDSSRGVYDKPLEVYYYK